MTKPESCPECRGTGWIDIRCTRPEDAKMCGHCKGTGTTPTGRECPGCRGTGQIEVRTVEQQRCFKCNGTGQYPPPESL